jgi:hypothetical protein
MPITQAGKVIGAVVYFRDISERMRAAAEREKFVRELQDALASVRQLSGLLPICASCKQIRNDKGYWTQIEVYVQDHSDAQFSHGICPECMEKLYPEFSGKDQAKEDTKHE